jgi:hypothetical protein
MTIVIAALGHPEKGSLRPGLARLPVNHAFRSAVRRLFQCTHYTDDSGGLKTCASVPTSIAASQELLEHSVALGAHMEVRGATREIVQFVNLAPTGAAISFQCSAVRERD